MSYLQPILIQTNMSRELQYALLNNNLQGLCQCPSNLLHYTGCLCHFGLVLRLSSWLFKQCMIRSFQRGTRHFRPRAGLCCQGVGVNSLRVEHSLVMLLCWRANGSVRRGEPTLKDSQLCIPNTFKGLLKKKLTLLSNTYTLYKDVRPYLGQTSFKPHQRAVYGWVYMDT